MGTCVVGTQLDPALEMDDGLIAIPLHELEKSQFLMG